jgi:membrane protease YdiL (CAAX protease family)
MKEIAARGAFELRQQRTWLACIGVPLLGVAAWAWGQGASAERLVLLLLLAPALEETVFRGGLQEALSARLARPGLANAWTACAFGLAHAVAHGDVRALAVVVPAWLVGRLYERSRRLLPCIALHALFNAAWVASTIGVGART